MKNNNLIDVYCNVYTESAINEAFNEDHDNNILSLDSLIEKYNNKKQITKNDIITLLNIAVCDELLASFNYLISYNISKTEGKQDFDPEFEAHKKEESDHADKLIKRLREMNAEVLTTPWIEYVTKNSCGSDWVQESSNDSIEILQNRYNEELNAIKFYSMILDCLRKMKDAGEWDSTTERLIKSIKDDEEQHELDLRDLLTQYGVTEIAPINDIEMNDEDDDDFENDANEDDDDFEDDDFEDEDFEDEEEIKSHANDDDNDEIDEDEDEEE